MVERDRETVLLEREYKKRLALEKARAKKIKRLTKKQLLKKKLKDLRYKQSKIGRTMIAGKIVFGRMGVIFKRMGTVAGKIGEGLEKSQKKVGVGTKTPQGLGTPLVKKKPQKPFDLNEALKRMPQ